MAVRATDGEGFEAQFNTLKHRDRVFTPVDKAVVTPNVDTPYSFLWMDLRTEPLVLGVPDIKYLSNDYIKRAVASKLGRFAHSKEEALYPLYLTDAEGKPLDATNAKYVLKLGLGDLPTNLLHSEGHHSLVPDRYYVVAASLD